MEADPLRIEPVEFLSVARIFFALPLPVLPFASFPAIRALPRAGPPVAPAALFEFSEMRLRTGQFLVGSVIAQEVAPEHDHIIEHDFCKNPGAVYFDFE